MLTQIFPNVLLYDSWVHKYGTRIGGGPTLYVTNVSPQANSAASWDSGETVVLGSEEASEHVSGIVWPLKRLPTDKAVGASLRNRSLTELTRPQKLVHLEAEWGVGKSQRVEG